MSTVQVYFAPILQHQKSFIKEKDLSVKIKQYAAAYLVIFCVLFSGDIKETFAENGLFKNEIKTELPEKIS